MTHIYLLPLIWLLLQIGSGVQQPCVAGSSSPAAVRVQGLVNSSATSVVSGVLSNVTAGNILILYSKVGVNGTATPAIGNTGVACTWNVISTSPVIAATFAATFQYCRVPSTGALTVTTTWTGAGLQNFSDIALAEYVSTSGWANPALDVSTATTKAVADTTCATGTTSATTVANEEVIAVCGTFNVFQTWSATVGSYANFISASRNTTGWFDQHITSTGTQSFSTTLTSDLDYAVIATFKQN